MATSFRGMHRLVMLLGCLALLAAACSSVDSSPETTAPTTSQADETTTTSPSSATTDPETTTPAVASATPEAPVVVDGPPAPDFTLALADGSDFVLSAEQKPVYMVFWAEW